MYPIITCTPKRLDPSLWVKAAHTAISENPTNRPNTTHFAAIGIEPTPQHIAVLATKYWGSQGKVLTMDVLDADPVQDKALILRILSHMNAWHDEAGANFSFVWSRVSPQVRILRTSGQGYWSYLGTDILHIPTNQQTMNLEGFTMDTPESEYHRVVRHETGHTLGFPHEHMRSEIVARLNRQVVIQYFGQTQGWSQQEVIQQILTPIDNSAIPMRTVADTDSIMCYQIPGQLTLDGQDIPGGLDLDDNDKKLAANIYPLSQTPPVQPPVQPPVTPPLSTPQVSLNVAAVEGGVQILNGSYDIVLRKRL